ncbi:Lipoprotein [Prescottella defluvii]|uniref:hypothetical protein n=1 Tax=Prescottella defluvii TaxID=1323361 RepID=UPI0004F3B001|nr:hypothetical protein [Prescottella defluvii]
MSRARNVAFGLVIGALTCGFLAACSGGNVSYRPPVATTFDRADCLAPDIQRRLTVLADDVDIGPPAEGIGYPPGDFAPVAVVRCERGENPSGALTIDSVRLEGDVAAAWDAFREESERFPDGTMAGCAFPETPSSGVWFVDEVGRAVRPAWPAQPCGVKPGPLTALAKLHEVDRQQHVTALRADDPGVCDTKFGAWLATTTDEDVRPETESERRARISESFALVSPIDDVGRLQVCRYVEKGEESVQESRSRLTAEQSRDVVRDLVAAPAAPACSLVATRTAVIPLYRADRSGGAGIEIELDGCTRASSWGLGVVVAPASVLAVVDGTPR